MLRKIGLFSARALAKASSPQAYQSTGIVLVLEQVGRFLAREAVGVRWTAAAAVCAHNVSFKFGFGLIPASAARSSRERQSQRQRKTPRASFGTAIIAANHSPEQMEVASTRSHQAGTDARR